MARILNFDGILVPEWEIVEAINILKLLRRKSLHPVAVRIALKYALAVDDKFAKQQLSKEQDEAINRYVQQLLKDVEKMRQ